MKRTATILFCLLTFTATSFGQGAVAVNDSAEIKLGEYITVHVKSNDYHPEGKSFRIQNAFDAHSFTDSTITFYAKYNEYYNVKGYIIVMYLLIDEDNVIGPESIGKVHLNVMNNKFSTYLDANNIRAYINPWGNQFWSGLAEFGNSEDSIHFEYPKGSGLNTLFNQSIWVGGYDQDQLKLAAERYRQVGIDYWTGPLSMEGSVLSIDSSTVYKWNRVWKLDVDDIIYHRLHWNEPGYEPIENIASWPAHGDPELNQSEFLAPFIDTDGDEMYDPYAGDYPLIRGDQCVYYIFNDLKEHTETQGNAIGLEIHGMAYQFNTSGLASMHNTVFLSYKIFNRSNSILKDTYIGQFCDFDVGHAWDDYVGCDVERGAFYGYNGDDEDGGGSYDGYGFNPPAQGIVILGGPTLDPNNLDDTDGGCDESITGVGFGDGIVDNERYGMTKFIYYTNSAGVQGDPQIQTEYYNYLKAIWKDGTAMEYGGNGHISSGAYGPACNFMFPGLSDPCYWGTGGEEPYGPVDWTEESVGNLPSDKRGLSVMGPFTFEPGTMQKVDLAFVTARGEDGPLSSVDLLKEYIDAVKEEYYKDSEYFGYQWLGDDEHQLAKLVLEIFPNPAEDFIFINHAFEKDNVNYKFYDGFGRLVKEGKLSYSDENAISISDLNKGLYILTVIDGQKIYSVKLIKN